MKLPTVLAGTPGVNLPLLLGLVGAAAVGLVVAVVVYAAVHYRRGGPWDRQEYRKLEAAEDARRAARRDGHVHLRLGVRAEHQKGRRRGESSPRTDAEGGSGGFSSPK